MALHNNHLICYCARYLQKDGQQLPGKKGIALKPDEWAKVVAAAPAISQAHAGRNKAYKLDLGSK
jgi:hypothetical protein